MILNDEAIAAFARDGVACLRSVLDPGEVAEAAAAIDAVLARPGPLAQVASRPDDPGAFTEDFRRWQEIPQIERLARHSRVPALAAALMATPRVRFYHDHVLVKEGGTTQRTPWHQDQPYYNVDGRGVSAWIPVDPVPADGCLELVAGSHRGPWLMPRTFLAKEARWFPEGSLAELPDIDAEPERFDIRRFELAPGDAIFFDFLTVHGAPGFPHRGRRRILSLRYLSADARHAPRTWRTSPPFNDLDAGPPGRSGHGPPAVSGSLADLMLENQMPQNLTPEYLMPGKEQVTLGAVQETLFITLAARAAESQRRHPVLRDPRAAELLRSIDYDAAKYGRRSGGAFTVLRTAILDYWIRGFLSAHPEGTVVELGTGLNTRFNRVDNGRVHWLDLDLPDTIELRRKFFTDTERRRMVTASVLDEDWLPEVARSPGPYFFVAEGVLVYLPEDQVTATLARIARRFPGARLALDTYSSRSFEHQYRMAARKGMDAKWAWACDDPRSLERLGLEVRQSATITRPPRDMRAQLPARYRYLVPLADPLIGKMMALTLFRSSSPAAAGQAGTAQAAGLA